MVSKCKFTLTLTSGNDYERKRWRESIEEDMRRYMVELNKDLKKGNMYNSISFKFDCYENK